MEVAPMPWSITLPDAENPGSNVTYTDANLEGLAYDDEPGGFRSIIASAAAAGQYANKATSGTSHNFTVSSKVFSIVGGFGFAAGSAVRCADAAGTSYMDGLVTAIDLVAQTLTVNVLSVGAGSGSNNSWVITLGTNTATIVSTPVSIANGGTAGTTASLARTNLAVKRHFDISSVVSTPPGSPTNGQTHIVGGSPTGAYVGHEHEITVYVNGTGWTFIVPDSGDSAYDAAAYSTYVYTGVNQSIHGIYAGSRWKALTNVLGRWLTGVGIASHYSVVTADHGTWMAVSTSALLNITLPSIAADSGAARGMSIVIEVPSSNGGNTVIAVSGGSNIRLADGTEAASITVNAGSYRCLHLVAGISGSINFWYVWRG
jgi:hypothetical protein